MEALKLEPIRTLGEQLLRGPRRLRVKQLLGIEFLLGVIDPGRRYPADFVCNALTGFRPTGSEVARLMDGGELVGDLVVLAEILSEDAGLSVEAWPEPVFSVSELARRLDVSTKTIFRWRRRGLTGWRLRCADRRVRLMFVDRCVRRFVGANASLVERGSNFSQLTHEQRAAVIARAQELVGSGHRTVNAVARVISAELGRAVETVRLILKQHDDTHAGAGIFNRSVLQVERDDCRLALWEAYVDGATVGALAERFGRPTSWVYATITEMRARSLRAERIDFVPSDEFLVPDADAVILERTPAAALRQPLPESARRIPAGLPPYLAQLFRIPLLTPAGEVHLFRKMNYLKFKAEQLRAQLVPETATADVLDRIDELVAAAASVKSEIVQANLRLVVGIAKRHAGPANDLFELISDGNVSLMRAVEKFDYTRGFKFSTYASWAIMKNFARSVPEQHQIRERYQTGRDELLSTTAAHELGDAEADEAVTRRAVLDRMLASLDEREQTILRQRFGLDGVGEPLTLEQIGQRFGVSKERIRQLETRAIGKLRADFQSDVLNLLGG